MPLVRAEIPAGRPSGYAASLGHAIQEAMHAVLGVPMEERFQVMTEHAGDGLSMDPSYLGIARSADAVIVQVFLNAGRDAATKERFYSTLAERLKASLDLRPEDLMVNLVEVRPEDWSFGNGKAQLTEGEQR